MSLIRSSMIAGVTTGLLGIGAMQLGAKDSYKQSYFWGATISTAVVGGLAWAILHNEKIEKTLELDAEIEYDGAKSYARSLDSKFDGANDEGYFPVDEDEFSEMVVDEIGEHTTLDAESESDFLTLAAEFAADRKARRRSRLSWTRGFEPSFTDLNGQWDEDANNGYEKPRYWLSSDPNSKSFAHYYIDFEGKAGTEGYHIHLWKPRGRPRYSRGWKAMAKSPHEDDWVEFNEVNKGKLTPRLLEWYNEQIATPTKVESTGFMDFLIQTGAVSGGTKLAREYLPPIKREQKDKEMGTRSGVTFSTRGRTIIYVTGGDISKPYKILEKMDNNNDKIEWYEDYHKLPKDILPFVQRLLFARGTEKLSNLLSERSINRYNKDWETWVKSYPAWFNSVVNNNITQCESELSIKYYRDEMYWKINDINFMKFEKGNKYSGDFDEKFFVSRPDFKVVEAEEIIDDDGDAVMTYSWVKPRPSTIRKMYNSMPNELITAMDNAEVGVDLPMSDRRRLGKMISEELFYQCVAKWQPQKHERVMLSMTKGISLFGSTYNDSILPSFGESVRSGEMMCRRFKKKSN